MTDVQCNGSSNGDDQDDSALRDRVAELERLQTEHDAAMREYCAAQAEWSKKMADWCQEQSDQAEQMRDLILAVGAALSPPRVGRPLPPPVPPVLTPSPER